MTDDDATIGPDRRSILKIGATLGTLGITGLAGCTGSENSGSSADNGSGGSANNGSGSSSSGNATLQGNGSGSSTTASQLPQGGTLVMGAKQGIETMSPFRGFLADYLIGEAMYDRLTRVDQDFKVHPNLARDWEHNEDYTKWTFTLNDGATFSNMDGQKVTADDVKATYDHLTSDDFTGSASSLSGVDSVSAVDEKTVEITTEDPDLEFTKRIAETGGAFFVVPKSVLEDDPSRLENTDYGSGPLILTNWNQKNSISFEANSDYHLNGVNDKPLPFVDKLEWNILSDETQRANSLSGGRVDAVSRISPKVTDRVKGQAQVVKQTSGLQYPIILDTKIEPFDNLGVRKAIKYGLDRSAILEATAGEGVLGHHSGITPVHTYYNEELPIDEPFGRTARPEKAKQKLSEAGFDDGFEVKTFYYDDGVPAKAVIAQLFQQQMRKIGIEFEIKRLTEEKWLADYWNQDGEWYVSNYSTRVLGSTILKLALRSEGKWNEANWSNKEFDKAFQAAATATDEETKAKNLKKCQKINHDEGAWVGTYHPKLYGAHKDYVMNYNLYPTYIKNYISQIAIDE